MSAVTDYWDNQWKIVEEKKEFEEYSQSIPNDFLRNLCGPRETLSVIKEALTVLDFGSGTGHMCHVLGLLNFAVVTGVEISQQTVDYANKKYGSGRINFRVQDILTSKFGNYDLIITSNTLEHFKNPFVVIDKLLEHCKHLIVLVPNKGTFAPDGEDGGAGHIFSFNLGSFDNYPVLETFVFFSRGWTEEPNPMQLCVLLKGKL